MMTNMKSNRNKAHLGLGALLLAGAFLAWLVLLGGVASVQRVASANGVGRNSVEFEWWILWFEAFVLFIAAFGHFLGFRAGHAAVVALLAVVTAIAMIACNSWNSTRRATNDRRAETLFAGLLLISFFNCLLILVMGTIPDESDAVTYRKGVTGASTAGPNRGVAVPATGATTVV